MKYRSNVYSITLSYLQRSSVESNMHYERAGRMGVRKYLRKSCCHRIECSTANFLAAFMWRRPLNSAVLATPTHKGPKGVPDKTNTQVVAWMINKWRIKIIKKELYNVRDPPWRRDWKFVRESIVTTWTISVTFFNQYILEHISSNWAEDEVT